MTTSILSGFREGSGFRGLKQMALVAFTIRSPNWPDGAGTRPAQASIQGLLLVEVTVRAEGSTAARSLGT